MLGDMVKQREMARNGFPLQNASWEAFKERYAVHLQSQSYNTKMSHQRALKDIEEYISPHSVSDVTPGKLDSLKTSLINKGIGKYMVVKVVKNAKALMRKAEAWGMVSGQDWKSVKNRKLPRGRVYFHSVEDLQKMILNLKGFWLTAVYLGSKAGLRPAEIYHSEVPGIDFKKNRLNVYELDCDQCPVKFHPKNHWTPKDHDARSIPIESELKDYLGWLIPRLKGRWLIQDEHGWRPTYESFTNLYGRELKRLGVKGTMYSLRHSFASHLIQAGVPMPQIRDYLGHDSIEMTEIYSKLTAESYDSDIERQPKTAGKP